MENPATWGRAERVISDAYEDWWKGHSRGRVGLSLARQIADALRNAGLLRDEEETLFS
jgi:hypothetical protein